MIGPGYLADCRSFDQVADPGSNSLGSGMLPEDTFMFRTLLRTPRLAASGRAAFHRARSSSWFDLGPGTCTATEDDPFGGPCIPLGLRWCPREACRPLQPLA